MTNMFARSIASLALAAIALPALAQNAAPQAPASPFSAENMSINEMVGDWSVRCFRVASIAPCDVMQLATQEGTNRRVMLVSIAYVPSEKNFAMQIVVPLGVVLAQGLTLGTGAAALSNVKFTRCERDGCYVESALPMATVDGLSAATGMTSISLVAYPSNEAVNLPVSLNGFKDAIAKMRAEANARATAPAAPQ